MKRNKSGISLITLVITIIIMIILAGAIILTLTNSGIFDKANDAVSKYSLKEVQSIADLAWAEAFADGARDKDTLQAAVDKALEDNDLDDKYKAEADEKGVTVSEIKPKEPMVGKKFEENGTIDGNEWNENNPIIPAGFIPINTETSKWDDGNLAQNVKNGLVITDEVDSNGKSIGNEFVWIPVATLSEFAEETTVNENTKDENGRTNYKGVLYNISNGQKLDGKIYYEEGWVEYYEPGILTEPDYDHAYIEIVTDIRDSADKFQIAEIANNWDQQYYQEQFNQMVESVAKYKGFYIARYETSADSEDNLQTKAGYQSRTGINWWSFYEKAAVFDNKKTSVVTEMVWGCQYDAMLLWMKENNIDLSIYEPIDTARGVNATANGTTITGAEDSNDILNNVYDVLGNRSELTQEVYVTPGGNGDLVCYSSQNRSERSNPSSIGYIQGLIRGTGIYSWGKLTGGNHLTTRMTLYVKN